MTALSTPTVRAPHAHDILFEPYQLGNLRLKNRFAMAPMGPLGFSDADGGWNARGIEYYVARAKGGTGLIITGVTFCENPGEDVPRPSVASSVVNPGHFIRTSNEMTERIHAYDAKILLQISPGFGRVIMPNFIKPGNLPIAPSPIPHRWTDLTCREMTVEEIHTTVKNAGKGALNGKRGGFDGVQIHAVHEGYLLDQFAISMFNQRTDSYGGSLENRLRFAREVLEEIKTTCGDDYPVTLRFSPKSMIKDWRVGAMPGEVFEEKGRDMEEGIEAARLLTDWGYDAIDLDIGSYDAWYWSHPPMYQAKGLYMPYSKQVKDALPDVPVILAGRMDDGDRAVRAITEGFADMISLGRPLLADPEWVNKLRAGRTETIRPCISCQEGCMGRIQAYAALNCAVNPEAGREADHKIRPAIRPKKVMVIGAGMAGLEAARVLAERGHKPEVFEAGDRLGGVVVAGGMPSFKEDDHDLIAWYAGQLEELQVPVHLSTAVTEQMIGSTDADHVILATGSAPRRLELGDALPVTEAIDALLDPSSLIGKRVAIVGGGLTGCELALHLKELDDTTQVTIVEAGDDVLSMSGPLCHANHDMLHDLVTYKGVEVVANAFAQRTTAAGLEVAVQDARLTVEADAVVTAIGYQSSARLVDAVNASRIPFHVLGDARKVSNIMYAIWDAFEVATEL
ncbi:FAD-dependent oxidoreductase [Demequina capsici]|uniref:FAD-dependent oxidoreductase n=1 Tax=Demequina capsici TaxID=3075620 RepID=A0AA96F968_9MICO|nr:FAD-dependent oxidoreductase [Demequina sp. OYTSA14]WNM25000.1 FAD-dependent oxidoreductase [Demequina sp. OYTSA14]